MVREKDTRYETLEETINTYKCDITSLENIRDELIKSNKNEVEALNFKICSLEREKDEMKEQLDKQQDTQEMYKSVEERYTEMKDTYETIVSERDELNETCKGLEKALDKLRKELRNEREINTRNLTIIKEKDNEIRGLKITVQDFSNEQQVGNHIIHVASERNEKIEEPSEPVRSRIKMNVEPVKEKRRFRVPRMRK